MVTRINPSLTWASFDLKLNGVGLRLMIYALIAQQAEAVMGAGLLVALVAIVASVVTDSRPDPKMALWIELTRSLPR